MAGCPKLTEDALAGHVVFQYNHDVTYGHSTWNTDLAIGPLNPR